MRLFLDTSSFAKRYIEEEGSDGVDRLMFTASELFLSILCIPELFSALNRRLRERGISRSDYSAIKRRIALDIRDINLVQVTSEIVQSSIIVMERSPVRALDALQIASALACHPDVFVSSDERQLQAAKASGLNTESV